MEIHQNFVGGDATKDFLFKKEKVFLWPKARLQATSFLFLFAWARNIGFLSSSAARLIFHGRWTMDHGPWPMDYAPWTMDHRPCPMDYGPWTMDHGPLVWTRNIAFLSSSATRLIFHGRWTMDHGPWPMDYAPRTMHHGTWTMELGPWTMDHGPWPMDYAPWTMDHGSKFSFCLSKKHRLPCRPMKQSSFSKGISRYEVICWTSRQDGPWSWPMDLQGIFWLQNSCNALRIHGKNQWNFIKKKWLGGRHKRFSF